MVADGLSSIIDTKRQTVRNIRRIPNVEVTHAFRLTTHMVSLALDDVTEEYETTYGGSFVIRPMNVRIEWEFTIRKGWTLERLLVSGPNIRKDGTVGMRMGSRRFDRDGQVVPEASDWLRELVEEFTPSGTLLVP